MKLIPQTSVGIEAAGPDLRIAVLREFAGKRRLVQVDVLAGFEALSEDDRITALVTHFKKNNLSRFNIHLSLPGTCGITRDLEFPVAVGPGDALRSAVALQVENLSPWAIDEIYWDCAWEPAPKGARSIIVHIAIIPQTILNPWIGLFRSARLALTGASLSSLSWAHGVSALWGTSRPTVILAAESQYVEGMLVQDGRICAVHNPGSEAAQLVPAAASQLMRAGRVESVDQLRVIGYGAASADAGLEPAQLPIEGAGRAGTMFGAIATALLGVARSGFRLNLIPKPLRYQRNYAQLVPTGALATVLLLLAVAAWAREPYQQLAYAEKLQAEVQRLAPTVRSVSDEETKLNRLSDRLRALDAVLRSRDSNLEALRELTRILPAGTWLTSYQYQDNGVTIAGVSESAASIQKTVEDSPVFRDAQFTSSITRDAFGKDRFTLRAAIEARP